MRGHVPGRIEKGGAGVLTCSAFFFFVSRGVGVKGRKERAQNEGCLGRSRVASKRGGVLIFCLARFCFLCVVGWCRSSARMVVARLKRAKMGELTGFFQALVLAALEGGGVGLVGACALMQPFQEGGAT